TTPGFDRHVPHLEHLVSCDRGSPEPAFVTTKIIVPHGTLRSRDLVSWDGDANQPAEVAFMGTKDRGFVANEAVLDIGDDATDYDEPDQTKFLRVTNPPPGIPENLWALTRDEQYVDETDPNTLEVLITNFAPQRRRG